MVDDIVAASYVAAALVYLFFFLLLLTDRRRGPYQWMLIFVALTGVAWAFHLWLAGRSTWALYQDSFLIDGLRGWVWALFFSAVISGQASLFRVIRTNPVIPLCGGVLLGLGLWRVSGLTILDGAHHTWVLLYDLSIACLVLLLIERAYRLADEEMRLAIRPLCFALGVLYLLDLYLFSQAMLFGQVEPMVWRLRGFGHLLAVPFFLLTTKRCKQWAIRIFVSRAVIYNSSLLLFVGLYLLLMSMAGYYLKYIGGEWGGSMRLAFILLAMALLLVIFLSESFRQQVKVFITKHFFANKYEYRDEWLAVTKALSRPLEGRSAYDHALRVVAQRLTAEQAALYRCINGLFECVSEQGQPPMLQGALERLVPFWSGKPWIVDLNEFRHHPERYQGAVADIALLSRSDTQILLPLFHQAELFGVIALGSSKLNQLNFEDRDYLKTLADQLVNFLVLSEASRNLAEAKQFETFNQMSAFLVHDLKNTLAQLQMMLVNAERHKRNPEFIDDSLETLANVVKRLQKTMEQLRREPSHSGTPQRVNLPQLVREVTAERAVEKPQPELGNLVDLDLNIDASRLKNVLGHLVQNAQEATEDSGRVVLSTVQSGDSLKIAVQDTGHGMAPEFVRERLFRPFDTTKGNAGMGIGVYEARQFALQADGRLEVSSQPGQGSEFVLTLPIT